jgi:stage III sporulation protein SpoIIIAA
LKVVVIDTSNEIGGDADQVHDCVGRSRRMMVRRREEQAQVMVEAVQNHSPEVVIVDEIGTKAVSVGEEGSGT